MLSLLQDALVCTQTLRGVHRAIRASDSRKSASKNLPGTEGV